MSYIREFLGDITDDIDVGSDFIELDNLVKRQDNILNEMVVGPNIAEWMGGESLGSVTDFIISEQILFEALVADKETGVLHDTVQAIVDILSRHYD